MILGTASHVGKSIITAGLGRLLANQGYRVAPFKAQNMSLNSAVTPDGLEIGRAQALQAEACRTPASVEMNPILLKPRTDQTSQVVVLGRVYAQTNAWKYHTRMVEDLFPLVLESFHKLASAHEVILLEGAGSPAEINLREHDIVNMRMAQAANASCLLVGDIDRGGVFASLLGTMELLEPHERELVKGFIINKFRGDRALLQPGIAMIEQRMGLPCTGVVPYLHDLSLEEEDSVPLANHRPARHLWERSLRSDSQDRPLRVGVIALPHMSNFTDFDVLAAEPSLSLAYIHLPEEIAAADLVILPGSKQTLDDLEWLQEGGFPPQLREHHIRKRGLIGICGGFQMLGEIIDDPSGIENDGVPARRNGLGFLPIHTVLLANKTTRPVTGMILAESFCGEPWRTREFQGYEIHVGETRYLPEARPLAKIATRGSKEEQLDGAISPDGLVLGSYVHGMFDNDTWRHHWIDQVRAASGLAPAHKTVMVTAERDARLNRLATHLQDSLDMNFIQSLIGHPASAFIRADPR
jgi:adenosylcobyric acid synthase